MLIEPLGPIKIRLPDGEIRQLVAGQPIDLPEPYASKLLQRAPGKVRLCAPLRQARASTKPTSAEWLAAWRELADLTAGLFPDDPRVGPVLHVLAQCDKQFQRGNWSAFLLACNGVLDALGFAAPFKPGWLIAYRDAQGRLCGGRDDRIRGTIACVERTAGGWLAVLTDGGRIQANRIVSVAETDETGRVIGAWTMKAHGLDGKGA